MSARELVLIGGPESGKSNYLAKLWLTFLSGRGRLCAETIPDNIKYVEDAAAYIHRGQFAPRTNPGGEGGSLDIALKADGVSVGNLFVPDVSGELWERSVETLELPSDWMARLEHARAVLIFVRVQSPQNVAPLDWVTSAGLLPRRRKNMTSAVPTQVALCEFMRFAQSKLKRSSTWIPRVAVMVTAWDRVDPETMAGGPDAYLRRHFPLFGNKVEHSSELNARVFGLSIFGGDPDADPNFRQELLGGDIAVSGFAIWRARTGQLDRGDLSRPVAWALGLED